MSIRSSAFFDVRLTTRKDCSHKKSECSFGIEHQFFYMTCSDYLKKIIVCINLYFFHNIDREEKEGQEKRSGARKVGKRTQRGLRSYGQWDWREKESSSFPFVKRSTGVVISCVQVPLFHSCPMSMNLVAIILLIRYSSFFILSRQKKHSKWMEAGWWQRKKRIVRMGPVGTEYISNQVLKELGLEGGGFIIDRQNLRKIYDFSSFLSLSLSVVNLMEISKRGEERVANFILRTTWFLLKK